MSYSRTCSDNTCCNPWHLVMKYSSKARIFDNLIDYGSKVLAIHTYFSKTYRPSRSMPKRKKLMKGYVELRSDDNGILKKINSIPIDISAPSDVNTSPLTKYGFSVNTKTDQNPRPCNDKSASLAKTEALQQQMEHTKLPNTKPVEDVAQSQPINHIDKENHRLTVKRTIEKQPRKKRCFFFHKHNYQF